MEEGKPKASTLFRFFFALQFWQVYPPTLSAHCFCTFFAFVFFALFSLVFRFFFAFFFAFHSRHPQILVSQMLPGEVPRVCLSRPCHPPPSPAASPRHPNPAPAPRPPKPFPTCPVPAPAAQPAQLPTGPATKSRACKQLSFRAFVFQRLSQLT